MNAVRREMCPRNDIVSRTSPSATLLLDSYTASFSPPLSGWAAR